MFTDKHCLKQLHAEMNFFSHRLHVAIDLLAQSFYLSHKISICRCRWRSMRKYNWISNRISISNDDKDTVGTDKDVQISSQLFAPQFQSDVRPPESRLNSSINWWEKLRLNSSNFSVEETQERFNEKFLVRFPFSPLE